QCARGHIVELELAVVIGLHDARRQGADREIRRHAPRGDARARYRIATIVDDFAAPFAACVHLGAPRSSTPSPLTGPPSSSSMRPSFTGRRESPAMLTSRSHGTWPSAITKSPAGPA